MWSDDEFVLALDLYLRAGTLGPHDPRTIAVSNQTRRLDPAGVGQNPGSISLRLANYATVDPNYPGRGMTGGGSNPRVRATFERYVDNRVALASRVAEIKRRFHIA